MREPLGTIPQTVIYYRSALKVNGVTFVLNQALINGVKMKLEWLVIKWECYGKNNQVLKFV